MNILFASEYYFANPDFVQLSKELAKRNHNISVVTSFRTADKKTEQGIKIFEIKPFVTIYKIPHTLSFPVSKVRQIIRKQSIDIVHTINDYSTNGAAAALVAKATKKPFVYTIQGPGTKTGHLLVDSIAQMYGVTVGRWLAKEAKKVILLSKSLISTAANFRIEKAKIVVIPSGINYAYFNPERPEVKKDALLLKDEFDISDEIIVGYAGRLFPAKGLIYLFSAVEKIQDTHPKIVLLIVGDGAQRNELELMAKKLKVRTIFAGWQRDLAPYYYLMDLFVLPSLFEGLPNVILEAMAMRKPIVATDVGGNADLITNRENGFLVHARDYEQLARALEELIGNSDLRRNMGSFGRQKVKKEFSWETIIPRVEHVYHELIENQDHTQRLE